MISAALEFITKYADPMIVFVGFAYAFYMYFKTKQPKYILSDGFLAASIFIFLLCGFAILDLNNEKMLAFVKSKADTLSLVALLVALIFFVQDRRTEK